MFHTGGDCAACQPLLFPPSNGVSDPVVSPLNIFQLFVIAKLKTQHRKYKGRALKYVFTFAVNMVEHFIRIHVPKLLFI